MSERNQRKTRAEVIISELYELVWNRGNYDAIDGLVAPRYTLHSDPGDPWEGKSLDRDTYRARVQYSRSAFPDLEFFIYDIFAAEDRVAVRWSAEGTLAGPLREIAATGKHMRFTGQTFYEIRGGRVAGHWQIIDRLGFMEQLPRQPPPRYLANVEAP
ncbi:ester cyclase [Pendulispora brunnea]|uniref:Ester cyclase n=1 Tax=Pendulispora brunnea TaxID=2905690 RepID=A0ABZ2KC63_9BACT